MRSFPLEPMPRWLRVFAATNGVLIILVMSNDLHNLVFRLDLNNPNWSSSYGYGVAFYFVMVGCALPLGLATVIMMIKAVQNPRKKSFVFPLALIVLLAVYLASYITRIPIAWRSDVAMVVGLFALLLFETAIRTGLIPVNTKYTSMFSNSPLRMQITDTSGAIALSSAYALEHDKDAFMDVEVRRQYPLRYDENTLLYSNQITGGYVFWKEDITGLNHLHKEIEESVLKIRAANSILVEEEKIKRAVNEESARTQLMTQLETEISRHANRLSLLLEQLTYAADPQKETVRIALLLCYIKRRCNLFFREREANLLPQDELTAYIDELAGIAGYADISIIVTSELKTQLTTRRTTLFYDFFFNVVEWASCLNCSYILSHIGPENGSITMRFLLSEDASSFHMDNEFWVAIASEGGVYAVMDLDDAFGISLSFVERLPVVNGSEL